MAGRAFFNITGDIRLQYDPLYSSLGLLGRLNVTKVNTIGQSWEDTTGLTFIAIYFDKNDTAKVLEVRNMDSR